MEDPKKLKDKKNQSSEEEFDELQDFIKKKKIQNDALKKIIDKLHSPEIHKNKKK